MSYHRHEEETVIRSNEILSPTPEPRLFTPFARVLDYYYGTIRCEGCSGIFISQTALEDHYDSNENRCVRPLATTCGKVVSSILSYIGLDSDTIHQNLGRSDQQMPGTFVMDHNDHTATTDRPPRLYGVQPRGVILRVRNPPSWVQHPVAKRLLDEFNLQGLFQSEVDAAYRVKKQQERPSLIIKMLSTVKKCIDKCYDIWEEYNEFSKAVKAVSSMIASLTCLALALIILCSLDEMLEVTRQGGYKCNDEECIVSYLYRLNHKK